MPAAVGDAAGAPGELERAPVVEEQPDQAQPRERAEHEAGGQPQHLAEPVGEVGRVDRREQHDRRQRDRQHAQHRRERERERPLADAHEQPLEVHRRRSCAP